MGNKQASEFEMRSSIEAEWQRAKRSFFEDVSISGIGLRRLTLIYCPSFKQGVAWDIRELNGICRVYRSRVCKYSQSVIGYNLLRFESKTLREYLSKLHTIKIELRPTGTAGLDGGGNPSRSILTGCI